MKMIRKINCGEQSYCWVESVSNSKSWSKLRFCFGSFSWAGSESWLNLKSWSNSLPWSGYFPWSRSRTWSSLWIRKQHEDD